jgi:hypothetical protein
VDISACALMFADSWPAPTCDGSTFPSYAAWCGACSCAFPAFGFDELSGSCAAAAFSSGAAFVGNTLFPALERRIVIIIVIVAATAADYFGEHSHVLDLVFLLCAARERLDC